jgi:hypothetical protein
MCMSVYLHLCLSLCLYVCMRVRTGYVSSTYIAMYICTGMCVYVCVCVHLYRGWCFSGTSGLPDYSYKLITQPKNLLSTLALEFTRMIAAFLCRSNEYQKPSWSSSGGSLCSPMITWA